MPNPKTVVVPTTIAILILLTAIGVLAQRKPSGRAVAPAKTTNGTKLDAAPKRRVTVVLKDDRQLKGNFLGSTRSGVQVSVASELLDLQWDNIKQIVFDDHATGGDEARDMVPKVDVVAPQGKTIDKFGVYINVRPLKDFAKDALAKIGTNEVKLDSTFKVVIAGSLGPGKDGTTIVLKDPKAVPSQGGEVNDPAMVKLAQDAILAVGDAGWFGYFEKLKAKNIFITIEQNDTVLTASVRADQPTENDAKISATGLSTILAIAVPSAKGDEQTLLKMAKANFEGKAFLLNLEIPKSQFWEIMLRKVSQMKEGRK